MVNRGQADAVSGPLLVRGSACKSNFGKLGGFRISNCARQRNRPRDDWRDDWRGHDCNNRSLAALLSAGRFHGEKKHR